MQSAAAPPAEAPSLASLASPSLRSSLRASHGPSTAQRRRETVADCWLGQGPPALLLAAAPAQPSAPRECPGPTAALLPAPPAYCAPPAPAPAPAEAAGPATCCDDADMALRWSRRGGARAGRRGTARMTVLLSADPAVLRRALVDGAAPDAARRASHRRTTPRPSAPLPPLPRTPAPAPPPSAVPGVSSVSAAASSTRAATTSATATATVTSGLYDAARSDIEHELTAGALQRCGFGAGTSLREVYSDARRLAQLRVLLAQEFSDESLEFYEEALRYASLRSIPDRLRKFEALRLYHKFIEPGAEREINLSYDSRERIRSALFGPKQPPQQQQQQQQQSQQPQQQLAVARHLFSPEASPVTKARTTATSTKQQQQQQTPKQSSCRKKRSLMAMLLGFIVSSGGGSGIGKRRGGKTPGAEAGSLENCSTDDGRGELSSDDGEYEQQRRRARASASLSSWKAYRPCPGTPRPQRMSVISHERLDKDQQQQQPQQAYGQHSRQHHHRHARHATDQPGSPSSPSSPDSDSASPWLHRRSRRSPAHAEATAGPLSPVPASPSGLREMVVASKLAKRIASLTPGAAEEGGAAGAEAPAEQIVHDAANAIRVLGSEHEGSGESIEGALMALRRLSMNRHLYPELLRSLPSECDNIDVTTASKVIQVLDASAPAPAPAGAAVALRT
eukprot:m51a1_g8959 hypothetical protein (679) ;mRNA; r:1054716-1056752